MKKKGKFAHLRRLFLRHLRAKPTRRIYQIEPDVDIPLWFLPQTDERRAEDKVEVMEVMKETVKTATSQAGSRCQTGSQCLESDGLVLLEAQASKLLSPRISSRTVMGDKLFTNKDVQFESLGDMKASRVDF